MVNALEKHFPLLQKLNPLIFVFIVLFTLSQTIHAQEMPDSLTLDLGQAQNLALDQNPQIQAAKKSVSRAESQVTEARGQFLPNVSAFGNYTHNFELPIFTIDFMGQQQTLRAGTKENITTGIQVEQPIYMGGAIRSGIRIADKNTILTSNQLQMYQQSVLLQVRQSYYRVLYGQQLITVAEEAIQNAERNLEVLRKQSELGTASGFDVLRAEVRLANLKPQLIAAQHQYEQAITALRTAIGLEPGQPIVVTGALVQEKTVWADSSLQSLQEKAYDKRLELANIQIRENIQRQHLSLARSNLLPKVSATTTWQYQLQSEELLFNREEYYRSIAGGINVSVPIFSGWKNRSKIEQARIALRQVSDQERQLRQQIAAEVETAYLALVQAEEQLASQQETVGQARKSLELAEVRFREGTATQLDVLNAQLAVQQAQTNESQYLLQYNIARDQLLSAMNLLEIESE